MAKFSQTFLLSAALVVGVAGSACADATLQSLLTKSVTESLTKNQVPGAGVVVQINGKIEAELAAGVRVQGRPELVTVNDRWHIGSDTKALTATMIARLVERGTLRFEDTLVTLLPQLASQIHPGYRGVTMTQLLSHSSGLPALTDDKDLPEFLVALGSSKDLMVQRSSVARIYLAKPPASAAGEFSYSNLGYIIAGAVAETRTRKPWEDLMREFIFAPLGIQNAGFGPPGVTMRADQPWGHKQQGTKLVPLDPGSTDADNPPGLGPAGTVHITLRDWMLYAQDQLNGVRGHGKLLKPETYRRLHTPVAGPYALGWGAKPGPDGVPLLLTHSGSNGYWLADVRIMPKKNIIVLIALNSGDAGSEAMMREVGQQLRDHLKPFE